MSIKEERNILDFNTHNKKYDKYVIIRKKGEGMHT